MRGKESRSPLVLIVPSALTPSAEEKVAGRSVSRVDVWKSERGSRRKFRVKTGVEIQGNEDNEGDDCGGARVGRKIDREIDCEG